jgi:metalloprotease
MIKRRDFIKYASVVTTGAVLPGLSIGQDWGKLIGAASNLAKAATLKDEDIKQYFDQLSAHYDANNPVAPPDSSYGKRLSQLSAGLENEDGLKLNIKAYLVKDINAFAMANGTIRVFAGLMNMMTDNEIRYVIGHEIGHVKSGHTLARMKTALTTGALKDAVSASGTKAASLADGQLGDLFHKVILAQHSQSNEREADDYSMSFIKRRLYEPQAAVSALEKLAALGGSSQAQWLSTHPSPKERADRMRNQV